MKLLCALAVFFGSFAQAQVFKVEEHQFRKKTLVYVTRALPNGLANEQLMNDILLDMNAALLHELWDLNSKNPIPDQLINSDDMRRWSERKKTLAGIVKQINKAIVPTRMEQPGEGVKMADMVPDAIMLYYPLFPEIPKINLLVIPAVIGTIVKRSVYEVPLDAACAALTAEQIKSVLQKTDTDSVGDCHLRLVNTEIAKDWTIVGMGGLDKKFFNGQKTHRSAGVALLWDTNNQFNTVVDVVGFGMTVSIGSVVSRFAKVGGKLVNKVTDLVGLTKAAPMPKGALSMSRESLETVEATMNLNMPTKFSWTALVSAFKNFNNYRAGAIYSDFELTPTYFLLAFDVSGAGLVDIFGDRLDEQNNARPVDPEKGSPLKIGAFGFAPWPWIKKMVLGQLDAASATDLLNDINNGGSSQSQSQQQRPKPH